MKYLECIIESGIFNEIKKADYIDAFEHLRVVGRNMRKGELIFSEEEEIDKICVIKEGAVRGEKIIEPGKEMHIINIYEKGSIFGLEAAMSIKKTAVMDYVCNEDATIVFIPIRAIKSSIYSEKIMLVLMQQQADDNIKKMNKIEILAEKSLRGRIMLYFSILMKKAGGNTINLNMNREQLAQYLSVNRSALSNELNKMKREGIIKLKKNQVVVMYGTEVKAI